MHSDTSDDFLPEEQTEVTTKVSCDALTSVVHASKPTLEESFQARSDKVQFYFE